MNINKTKTKTVDNIFFLHFSKCAGTTLVRIAKQTGLKLSQPNYNGNPCTKIGKETEFWGYSQKELVNYLDHLYTNCNFVSCEYGFPLLNLNIKNCLKLKMITILRDPFERYISSCGTHSPKKFYKKRIPGKFPSGILLIYYDNFYTRLLSRRYGKGDVTEEDFELAKTNLQLFDAIVILELPNTYKQLNKYFGEIDLINTRYNVNKNKKQRSLDTKELEIRFRKDNTYDYKLYEYAIKLANKITDKEITEKKIMTEKKSMDKKYIFILTPGRSGSTLISHLLSNSLPKPTISQEGSGVCIKILHHYLTNNGNLPENIQDLIAQLEKNRHSNRQTSDPHYQYSYRPILYQDLIEAKDPQKLMSLLFNCDEQIVGSKNLCYLPYRSTEQLLMYLEIVDLLPNVYLVFHTRSPRDWFRSRRIKRFFLLGDESLSMLQEHIDLVNELVDGEQIFVTSHENVVNDCYNILTKLGVETTIERLNRLKKTRCSY